MVNLNHYFIKVVEINLKEPLEKATQSRGHSLKKYKLSIRGFAFDTFEQFLKIDHPAVGF